MTAVDFWVPGVPVPKGSLRHVGNGRLIESAKGLADWRHAIKDAAWTYRLQQEPFDGPVWVAASSRSTSARAPFPSPPDEDTVGDPRPALPSDEHHLPLGPVRQRRLQGDRRPCHRQAQPPPRQPVQHVRGRRAEAAAMTGHEPVDGFPLEVRQKPTGRPDGWFAACTCGATGPARKRQSQCLIDFNQHLREMKEAAA